jgi:hypothetical protein
VLAGPATRTRRRDRAGMASARELAGLIADPPRRPTSTVLTLVARTSPSSNQTRTASTVTMTGLAAGPRQRTELTNARQEASDLPTWAGWGRAVCCAVMRVGECLP